jgi:hypothetical protein
MNTFRRLFSGLRAEVRASKHQARFAEARQRHAAFADHHAIVSVLGVLAGDGQSRYAEKDALTCAVLAEHQSSPSTFWASALLVAYYPMLSRLRHRIYGDALPGEDLDQLVVTSFLSVVADYPLDAAIDRTAMRLRQRTERLVFRVVCEEQDGRQVFRPTPPEDFEDVERTDWPEARVNGDARPLAPSDAADAVSLLVEHAGRLLDGETFDLVTATLICGHRIAAYLEAVLPDLTGDERRRLYQRVKRRHSRTLKRIRPALAHLRCPCGEALGLCECRDQEPEEVAER